MLLSGAQIILRKLREQKVKFIFEFPGGSICPILDELYKTKVFKVICFRHEQAAIHAADAFARITKEPSVCMATSGPGASNLVTGIANAYMDSVPIVVITGQVAEWDLKKHRPVRQRGFQELDIVSVVRSITKAAFLVNHLSGLGKVIDKAFFIAKSGRPGPVLIDVPINLQYTQSEYKDIKLNLKEKKPNCSNKNIIEIARRLKNAKKPLVLVGGGVVISNSQKKLMRLLNKLKLPVAQTLMGLSAVSSGYEFNLGLVGYAGSRAASNAIKEADFILGLGLRFDNRAFPGARKDFSKRAYIVHIDCDRTELNHRIKANKAMFSDLSLFLDSFFKKVKYKNNFDWLTQIERWCGQEALSFKNRLSPQYIISKLSELSAHKETVVTTDVGQHQLWAGQYFKFYPKISWITSGGLGTMGFGLPAAIGAQFSKPRASVVHITSDGSLQMNIQELATVKDYGLPIKIILLNNKCLGLVRQIQEFAFSKRYASTCVNANVNFVNIAKAYGIEAFLVNSAQEVDRALKRIISSKKSILADFRINQQQNVFPVRVKGRIIYNNERN